MIYKKKKNKKEFLINIGLMLFTIVLLFILMEIIINIFHLEEKKINYENNVSFDESKIRIHIGNPLLPSVHKPGSSIMLAGSYVKINSLGFRDYEYSLKKPKDVYRIAVVGDSFTFGYGINLTGTYPKILERMLNNHSNKKFEVLNLGMNGANTLTESEYIKEFVLDLEPDLILLGFFPNDADGDKLNEYIYNEYCLKNAENFSKTQLSTKAYQFAVERFNNILLKIEEKDIEKTDYYFIEIYKEDYKGFICMKEGVKRISQISKENNLPILALIIPTNDNSVIYEPIYEKIQEIFKQNSIESFNLFYAFGDKFGSDELMTEIGAPHYNDIGNRMIAEAVYKILLEKNITK